jgi:hypothetical protein
MLDAIANASSAEHLDLFLQAARAYFAGVQREALEEAVAKRRAELADGGTLDG